MARISLCLIAKNEEAMLPGCIASARDACDEIVLVDTGSTDRTLEIAREAGAVVLVHPWNGDFSAARNKGLVRATGTHVLQLDCDERLAPGAAVAIRAAAQKGVEVGLLRLHNATRLDAPPDEVLSGRARLADPLIVPRFFRRRDGVRYRNIIHETVSDWFAARDIRPEFVAADIVHLGYAKDAGTSAEKYARNVAMLERASLAEPHSTMLIAYLAVEHYMHGDLALALAAADRGFALVDAEPRQRSVHRLLVMRAISALRLGDHAKALASADKLIGREGASSDALLLRGWALLASAEGAADSEDRLAQAGRAFLQALSWRDRPEHNHLIAGAASWRAELKLGETRLASGRAAEAAATFEGLLRDRPGDREVLLDLADARIDAGIPLRALEVLEPLLDDTPDGWLLAAAAAWALDQSADARLFFQRAVERASHGIESWYRRRRFVALSRTLAAAGAPPG
jgi:glycosyltransferase involved in cell wall biosynthesis